MSHKKSVVITGLVVVSLLVGISPLLGFSIPRATASSPQNFYPDLNSVSGCGYGLDTSAPSFGLRYFGTSTFTMMFCGTANQTWSLTNATFSMKFDPLGTEHTTVTVSLSDNGTVIAKSSSTPTTISGCCCATPYSFSLSPSNGGVMRSGDRLTLNVTISGNSITGVCTGIPYVSTLSIYGAPPLPSLTTLSQQQCKSLLDLPYGQLSAGTNVTELYAPAMTFTVPNMSHWYWYFVPSNGQNPNATAVQVVTQLWSSGRGQNFDFFVGTHNGNVGVILRTDYSLTYECSG